MSLFIALLFCSTATTRPVTGPPLIGVESQRITLSKRPRLGEKVTAIYELIPVNSKNDLKVIFTKFLGIKPVSKDTIFCFDAENGKLRTFSIDLEYFATPATFKVRVCNHTQDIRIFLIRHLLNAKTGEYGSMKELQYNPPLEYRFNPRAKKFAQEVLNFEEGRWYKNRGIIDTIKTYAPDISDSLALVLYADISKITYLHDNRRWSEKAEYLLKQGWLTYIDKTEREKFLKQLRTRDENIHEKRRQELLKIEKMRQRTFILSWLIPVILLALLLVVLLMVRGRKQGKTVTSKWFDRIITYTIYVFLVGIALYFAWPYLGIKRKPVDKRRQEADKTLSEIEQQDVLKELKEFTLVSKEPCSYRAGFGGIFHYKDVKHSRLGMEYYFSIFVRPSDKGFLVQMPSYAPGKAIKEFEANKRILSFAKNFKIVKASLKLIDKSFIVTLYDTIEKNGVKYPISLEYDGSSNLITKYVVPSDFQNPAFPEIERFKDFCERAGYPVLHGKSIVSTYRGYPNHPGLATVLKGTGNDTLWVWFFSEKSDDFTYCWIPVPSVVTPPHAIIDQVYSTFEKAGLDSEYIENHIKLVSAKGLRQPNYFISQGDKVILEAAFKWETRYDWIDGMNNGKGVQFNVSYEYYADSQRLGKRLGGPATQQYLRPIRQLISRKEAREKLFSSLPEELQFNAITVGLNFHRQPNDLDDFIYLVGKYRTPTSLHHALSIKVNLETGEVLGPHYLGMTY